MKTLLIATHNVGKFNEFKAILAPQPCISSKALGLQSPEETGLSFIENAILKARFASHHSKMPALADDSGLVVPALKGAPGIYSARFKGPEATPLENTLYLLECMKDIPKENRGAYFYCALALVQHELDPTPIVAVGAFNGLIHHTMQGDNGFGYDPIFYLPQYETTLASLAPEIKNTISHRAIALKDLKIKLNTLHAIPM